MLTTLDKFGRIIIPKRFREHLGINFETALNISEDGKRIVIELIKEKNPVIDKDGILVFTGKLEDTKNSLIESDRNRRMRKLLTSEE
ncbi:MAG: AbrB/MazE/SpoVT family DNA-binding domain-containing protein [Melioribacteraceae bacterium]|nr:AbrB/MazE/SpoVT family DNA-binding domain-containing protein [Melioribacteraceae bacterium]MCF8262960.1 AbrB/MazE/SpoVT family DNA-binding domain-containing protein [Melioribacteraceae bacterium]MCF8413331.1 AbrB/MazE/SpoVT family DNA-binding domain-containing protein [Melioribacteraceae bacterium]MCF8430607.1 AbrB/MazE/SpoVT family DNA-binding domain-containing protein [Melioribacteraceae bacterium]